MAPKQTDLIENPPPMVSSSEEEEESASSGEESDSSGPDSKKHESNSNSDPDPGPDKTKIVNNKTLVTKTKPETSGSMALPESSTAKRPLKQTEEDVEVKKKMKKNQETQEEEEEEVKKVSSGDETKKQLMFQRLFSENDEIALLQGILDFTSTRGDPYEKMDVFCDYVKKLINFDANKSQLVTKIRRLKKKFANTIKNSLKKGKSEDEIVFSKDLDQKCFELSRKVWGNNGVLASKSRKKLGENSKEIIKFKKEEQVEKPKQNVVSTRVSTTRGGEIASFLKAENATSFGLDESTVNAVWEMVSDGPKKKEMEEKLKKLKALQGELCLGRTELVAETTKVIFNDSASSSCK